MKLDFICPGVSKAGTTTLHDILKLHPSIILPDKKETDFFVDESKLNKGIDFYFNNYFDDVNNKIIGEICPQYTSSSKVAERLYNTFGKELKIIFMFREPVTRAYSHYLMKTRTFENLTFQNAISNAIKLKNSNSYFDNQLIQSHLQFDKFKLIKRNCKELNAYRYTRYIYPGLYATIIKNYLQYFSIENMHFIIFEEFIKSPEKHIVEVLDFLQIKEYHNFEITHSNARKVYKNSTAKYIRNLTFLIPTDFKLALTKIFGQKVYSKLKSIIESIFISNNYSPKIDKDTFELLKKIYKPEVIELETMLKKKIKIWEIY